jgi:hypothetical protein
MGLAVICGGPASALDISFPLDVGGDTSRVRTITVRARTLKELFRRYEVTYSGEVYRKGIYGSRASAFSPDKTYQTNNLGLFISSKLRNGLDYEVKLTTRMVTDPSVSFRDDLHFTAFYATLGRAKVWNVRAGDLYPNFSRYTLNRFVKGASAFYNRDFDERFKVRLSGVLARAQRSREHLTLRRIAVGTLANVESLRLDRGKPKWQFGYRWAGASDELGSVDHSRTLADLQIDVHSLTYGAQLPWGWMISGENAWSTGSADRRTARDRDGNAWLTDLAWVRPSTDPPYKGMMRLAPFAFQFNWERVDPYFQSPLGIAAPNQLRWNARTAHRFNPNADWSMSFLRIEDNVRNQAVVTNITRTSNVAVNLRPFHLFGDQGWSTRLFPSIRDIRTKLEFRYSDRDATNGTVNNRIEDYLYSVQYTNLGINFVGDYQFQITDDEARPANDRRLQAYGLRATRPLHWKKWDIRFFPTVAYRVSRDRFRLTGSSTFQQTTTLGLSTVWEELAANFQYLIIDADKAPAGSDYLQNKVSASVTYKPYLFPSFSSTLSYGYSDVDDETLTRSYRQTETKLAVSYTF